LRLPMRETDGNVSGILEALSRNRRLRHLQLRGKLPLVGIKA
jgi:hypothetical protein